MMNDDMGGGAPACTCGQPTCPTCGSGGDAPAGCAGCSGQSEEHTCGGGDAPAAPAE